MAPTSVNPAVQTILHELEADILAQHKGKEYRPVVVIITEDLQGRILLLSSAKGPYWGFPQGGAQEGEAILEALARELEEETGIQSSEIEVRAFCGIDQLDIPRSRDGFTKGKRYYYFHVVRVTGDAITLQKEEASDHRWVPRKEVAAALAGTYEEKRSSMLWALRRAQTG
jgi:8-oxo-dGTP pyrophosphatase MutT (NUDIX family)